MIRSFISAVAGWIVALVALPIAVSANHVGISAQFLREFWLLPALWIIPVWLVVLWPLYVSIPASSDIWHPSLCITCGVIAGGLLIALPMPYLVQFPPHPYFCVGPFVGGVTCAVGCYLKKRESTNRA